MNTFSVTSIESRIKQEWGWFRGVVAIHPYLTHGVALVAAYVAGWAFKGWPL